MDYYRELGVRRDADLPTIKRAFRRMAKRCHPDVSRHDDADEHFKRVRTAYEVLSDPVARAEYDDAAQAARKSPRPARRARGRSTAQKEQTFDSAFAMFDDLEHSLFEDLLSGLGLAFDLDDLPLAPLKALVEISEEEAEEGCEVPLKARVPVTCPLCDGAGRRGLRPCRSCHGTGRREMMMDAVLELPAGMAHGETVAVPVHVGGGHTTFVEVAILITR